MNKVLSRRKYRLSASVMALTAGMAVLSSCVDAPWERDPVEQDSSGQTTAVDTAEGHRPVEGELAVTGNAPVPSAQAREGAGGHEKAQVKGAQDNPAQRGRAPTVLVPDFVADRDSPPTGAATTPITGETIQPKTHRTTAARSQGDGAAEETSARDIAEVPRPPQDAASAPIRVSPQGPLPGPRKPPTAPTSLALDTAAPAASQTVSSPPFPEGRVTPDDVAQEASGDDVMAEMSVEEPPQREDSSQAGARPLEDTQRPPGSSADGEDTDSTGDRTARVRDTVREVIEQRRKMREGAEAQDAVIEDDNAGSASSENRSGRPGEVIEDVGVTADTWARAPDPDMEMRAEMAPQQEDRPTSAIPPLSLTNAPEEAFIHGRDRLEGILLDRMARDLPYVGAALDVAEYHVLHVLPEEALGFLSDLDHESLTPEEELRLSALRDIALLQRQPFSLPELDVIGQEDHSPWLEWAPWTLYTLAHQEKWDEAAKLAGKALERTADYPDALKRLLLPVMAEAIIRGGNEKDVALVKPVIQELDEISVTPAERTALSWLMGLAAERAGKDEVAATAWAEASAGEGRHAQKARIALVDLGLASGKMTRAEAEALLSEAHNLWRGDDLEVDLLMRLAILRESVDDLTGAVIALNHLASGFPDLPVAEQARERMSPLLDRLYSREIDEEWTLSRWVASHSALDHALVDTPAFVPYREKHARTMLEAGLTAEAAREYAKLSRIAPEEDRSRFGLKQVESLLAGRDIRKAAATLTALEKELPTALEQEAKRLWMRIAAEAGPGEEYATTRSGIEADSLEDTILLGRLYWNDRNWEKVKEAYGHLRTRYPEHFGRDELLRYMLAAYRSGDAATFMAASREHADMIENAEWREIAQSLISDPPAISPLGQEEAYQIIDQAEEVGGLVFRAIGMEEREP